MSGPIIRKYGFPNFESIFGKREMAHGADDDESGDQSTEETQTEPSAPREKAAIPPAVAKPPVEKK